MDATNSTCTPPSCWDDGTCDPVAFNPDVAGPGVISAYFASAMLAVTSICIAYITESLPETYYNEFDRSITCNKFGHLRISKGFTRYPRAKRIKASKQFVLALSDQQLVTGFCVVVGALVQPYKMTSADFSVVTALAWFSSTVHLVTLIMLKDYFREYPSRYLSRAVFMVIVLVLLILAVIVSDQWWGKYPGLPLSCLFSSMNIDLLTLDNVIWLVYLFASAILAIAAKPGSSGSTTLSLSSRMLGHTEARELLKSRRVREMFLASVESEIGLQALTRVASGKSILAYLRHYCFNSFWLEIGGVSYLLSYGIAFFLDVYNQSPGTEIPNEIGYGQILPMLLLVLPFLALFESIWDLRDRFHGRSNITNEKDQGSQHSSAPSNDSSASALIPEPASVRFQQEYNDQEEEIKRLFPFEYMVLTELEDEPLVQAKQALLISLLNANANRTATLISCRHWFQVLAFIYLAYSVFLGWFAYQTSSVFVWIAYLPDILIFILSTIPYIKAFWAIRRGETSHTGRKLLKLLRLTYQNTNKENRFNAVATKVDDTSVTTAVQLPLRKQWTL